MSRSNSEPARTGEAMRPFAAFICGLLTLVAICFMASTTTWYQTLSSGGFFGLALVAAAVSAFFYYEVHLSLTAYVMAVFTPVLLLVGPGDPVAVFAVTALAVAMIAKGVAILIRRSERREDGQHLHALMAKAQAARAAAA